MTETTEILELMGGIIFLLWGVSFLLRAGAWSLWFRRIERDGRPSALGLGSMLVIIGGIILGLHPLWDGVPLLLTITSMLAIVMGAMCLLFPELLSLALRCMSPFIKPIIRMVGLILIVLALLLLQQVYDNRTIEELLDTYSGFIEETDDAL